MRGLQEGIILPTINLEPASEFEGLDFIPNTPRRVVFDIALSNSFGFGGNNAALIFGQAHD